MRQWLHVVVVTIMAAESDKGSLGRIVAPGIRTAEIAPPHHVTSGVVGARWSDRQEPSLDTGLQRLSWRDDSDRAGLVQSVRRARLDISPRSCHRVGAWRMMRGW